MATRYFHLEDPERVVKLDGVVAYVWWGGEWHESRSAWAKVTGFDGADGVEITTEEAERLMRADRFTWTEKDLGTSGVHFHRAEPEDET
jgi:hypothetical protein